MKEKCVEETEARGSKGIKSIMKSFRRGIMQTRFAEREGKTYRPDNPRKKASVV